MFALRNVVLLALAGAAPAQFVGPFQTTPTVVRLTPGDAVAFDGESLGEYTVEIQGKVASGAGTMWTMRLHDPSTQYLVVAVKFNSLVAGWPRPNEVLGLRTRFQVRCQRFNDHGYVAGRYPTSFEWRNVSRNGPWTAQLPTGNIGMAWTEYGHTTLRLDFGRADSSDDFGIARTRCFPEPQTYGVGCPGPYGDPRIASGGLPKIGTSFPVDLENAARLAPAVLSVGTSNRRWRGLALPFALSQLFPGSTCQILAGPDVGIPARTDAGTPGSARAQLPLPSDRALHGVHLYMQWAVFDGRKLSMTPGLDVVIGE